MLLILFFNICINFKNYRFRLLDTIANVVSNL